MKTDKYEIETFDRFEKEQEIIRPKIETINSVAEKLKQKYSDYEVLLSFIDHLASTERIFVSVETGSVDFKTVKKNFLDAETELISNQLGINRNVFDGIIEQFRNANDNVAGITIVADTLKRQHSDDKKIVGFIEYIKNALIEFLDIVNTDNVSNLVNKKIIIIERKIDELSADGDPEKDLLINVYNEFKQGLLSVKKKIEKSSNY